MAVKQIVPTQEAHRGYFSRRDLPATNAPHPTPTVAANNLRQQTVPIESWPVLRGLHPFAFVNHNSSIDHNAQAESVKRYNA